MTSNPPQQYIKYTNSIQIVGNTPQSLTALTAFKTCLDNVVLELVNKHTITGILMIYPTKIETLAVVFFSFFFETGSKFSAVLSLQSCSPIIHQFMFENSFDLV